MKRIRINKGKAALVIRNGDYRRVLTPGLYWVTPFDMVIPYSIDQPFHPPVALDLLLEDETLSEMLTVIEVQDNEIALQYKHGNLKDVLGPDRYAFWKSGPYSFVKVDLSKIEITEDIDVKSIRRKELVPYIRVCKVDSNEKGVLFVNNQYVKILDPGEYYFWKNAIEVAVSRVDLRTRQLEIPGQEILTRDKAALRVNFIAQYKVVDVEKALIDNKDCEKQLYHLVQLALRSYVGQYTLDELLDKKNALSTYVLDAIREKSGDLGVEVIDCGVRDIILPGDVKDIMNQVLVAQKKAQANVIMRREETASTRSLLNTARLMESNEMLWKLKEMEYVEKIADKIGEITVSGNGHVIDQLRGIFTPTK